MALQKRPAAEATARQLVEYLELNGIDVPAAIRSEKDELVQLVETAKLPDPIFVSEEVQQVEASVDGLSDLFSRDFTEEAEHWCRIRLAADQHAEDKGSAVPVIHGNDVVFLPRMKDLVVRERFLRVLNDARELRVVQAAGDGMSEKFSEARKVMEFRAPFTFLGTYGLVSEGSPQNVPDGVQVIR